MVQILYRAPSSSFCAFDNFCTILHWLDPGSISAYPLYIYILPPWRVADWLSSSLPTKLSVIPSLGNSDHHGIPLSLEWRLSCKSFTNKKKELFGDTSMLALPEDSPYSTQFIRIKFWLWTLGNLAEQVYGSHGALHSKKYFTRVTKSPLA